MPRKDPDTGCPVMTMNEYLSKGAKEQGCEPYEVLDDIFESLEADDRKVEQDYINNPDAALEILLWAASLFYEESAECQKDDPSVVLSAYPLAIEGIEEAIVKQSFRSCHTRLVGIALCSDGIYRKFTVTEDRYSGSYYEPPE